jgi:penicillin amidase
LLASKEKISAEECRHFQLDQQSIPAQNILPTLLALETDDPDALLALKLLKGWDGVLDKDSVPASIYEVFLAKSAEIILTPALDKALFYDLMGVGSHPILIPKTEFFAQWSVSFQRMLQNPNSGWLPGNKVARAGILSRALSEAIQEIRSKLGNDTRRWGWGNLHQVTFAHALAQQPPLDKIFNVGPFPLGGDPDTVAQAATRPDDPFETNAYGVSWRHIVDWGNKTHGIMFTPGQSGHLASPNYDDLAEKWLNGELVGLGWEGVEECRHSLTLKPV